MVTMQLCIMWRRNRLLLSVVGKLNVGVGRLIGQSNLIKKLTSTTAPRHHMTTTYDLKGSAIIRGGLQCIFVHQRLYGYNIST